VAKNRPINADVPAARSSEGAAEKPPPLPKADLSPPRSPPAGRQPPTAELPALAPPAPPNRGGRRPIPLALKVIAALVVVAVAFIAAAILGGKSQNRGPKPGASAPVGAAAAEIAKAPAAQTAAELGFPAFATNNTTRVGGADPASNAAGVALATYPSSTPGQRPAAVTLVGEEDWQAAIAASVLMAAPIKAPILISATSGVPQPTATALAALDPRGSGPTGGAQAFAIGEVTAPADLSRLTRVRAPDGAAAAVAIERLRERLLGVAPEHIVIAPAQEPGFAMPAAAWAARSGDPVLFAERNKLPKATAAGLKLHPRVSLYVLGPASAISSAVLGEIAKIDSRVHRVSGTDPVTNAIALARYSQGNFGWNINDPGHGFVVARSDSPLDAAAAAPLSASGTWGPLLLTDSDARLPTALRGYLLDVKPGYTTDPTRAFYNHVWVIGDEGAIDVNQQAEIDNLAALTKIGGEP
jgi:hypothetical protein